MPASRVAVLNALLREAIETTRDFGQVFADRTVAANLAREAALEPRPLGINVKVAVELRPVSLDAGFRSKSGSGVRHQNVPPLTTPEGATPSAVHAAA